MTANALRMGMGPAMQAGIQHQAQSPLQPAAIEPGSSAPPILSGDLILPTSPLVMFRLPKHRQIGGAGRPEVPALVMRTYEGSDAVDLVVFFGYEDIRGFQRVRRLTQDQMDEGGWHDPQRQLQLEVAALRKKVATLLTTVEGFGSLVSQDFAPADRVDDLQKQITALTKHVAAQGSPKKAESSRKRK